MDLLTNFVFCVCAVLGVYLLTCRLVCCNCCLGLVTFRVVVLFSGFAFFVIGYFVYAVTVVVVWVVCYLLRLLIWFVVFGCIMWWLQLRAQCGVCCW